ncbi:MAG: tetrahydromethanopterin S-methyltransferase subunit F [Candidatus Methanomethylicota archaeon]|uniref:Tetrahydromethanopterin S-methyltransferase subunit F n=1 Tax=Thermoproteota archaeon TaxID=2056631 RepID=A0A497ETI0_9CREN|nr:MAG: tetrahydromethanopterin S-methyltransferase subunit F [Candidatus Verstraetearchaeota archaeon]RLE50489.1 MAG: tetrahydromethanopterin S-methyltransferase subunit F [Candidatus Verstraetearchaeota archaeon]
MSEEKRVRTLPTAYTPELATIEARISDIKTRILMIGRENRFAAGFYSGVVRGFMFGFIFSVVVFASILHFFFGA